jgi:arabinofuranosyltransferase
MNNFTKYFLVLLYTLLVTFIYWFLYGKPMIGIDDANIYFVYVRNFVEGNGFVYTAGGERVEGFTSIFWVLLISPLYWLGKYFEIAILILNVFIISTAMLISINFINRITDSKNFISPASVLFLILLTVIPGYFDWTILTLMETGLWSLLIISITVLLCNDDITSRTFTNLSFLLSILLLTRPESLAWAAFFLVICFLRAFVHGKNFIGALKRIQWPIVSVVVTLAALTGFRILYFGFPLPNTYYAKVSTNIIYNITEGIRYFIFCAIQSPLILLIVVIAIVSIILIGIKLFEAWRNKRFADISIPIQVQFILTSVTLISILIPIYVGGDHFKLLRFYQPFFPVYLFLFFNFLYWKQYISVKYGIHVSLPVRLLLVCLTIPFLYLLTDTPLHTFLKTGSPIDGEFRLAELGIDEAKQMNDFFAPLDKLPTVGVSAAGGFGYAYAGNVVDLMGLNNVTMAHAIKEKVGMKNHAAFDKETFYLQKPEVFHGYKKISAFVSVLSDTAILENDPDFINMHVYRLYKRIFFDEQFRKNYTPAVISRQGSNLFLKSYFTFEVIEKLQEKGYTVDVIHRKAPPVPPE